MVVIRNQQNIDENAPVGPAYAIPAPFDPSRQDNEQGLVGRVLLYDNFEPPAQGTYFSKFIKVDEVGTGTISGNAQVLPFEGSYHLAVNTGATSANRTLAKRSYGLTPHKKIKVTVPWRFRDTNTFYVYFENKYFDATNRHDAHLRYNTVLSRWEYLTAGNTWAAVTQGSQTLATAVYHRLEFVIDFSNNVYEKILSDDLLLDISTVPSYVVANTSGVETQLLLGTDSQAAASSFADFDQVKVEEID